MDSLGRLLNKCFIWKGSPPRPTCYLFIYRTPFVNLPLKMVHVLGCQNEPATGAITGYLKVFAACKLLERRKKNRQLKKLWNRKRKRNCFNHDLYVLFCEAPYLPRKHISLVICVPPPGKHISLVIWVPLPGKHISLVICIPPPGKHNYISSDICSPNWETNIPSDMCSPH